MLVCWSIGGGGGTSVVAAGLAAVADRADDPVLLVDLGGDQPTLHDVPEPEGPGLAEWLRAPSDVPVAALRHLEVELADGTALLPRGGGALRPDRAHTLADGLLADDRAVVVDAGMPRHGSVAAALVDADRSFLIVRACPVSLRRLERTAAVPTGIVVVRDRRRSVTWREVAAAGRAPVVAELEVDPAVAAAVDAGLCRRSLPRRFLRALEGLG